MRMALDAGAMRTYVEDFDELRVALRETHAADSNTILHLRVEFDMVVLVQVMGSMDLVLAGLTEAFRFIGPRLVQSSLVRVTVSSAGRRDW
jgi:hypothetical protein